MAARTVKRLFDLEIDEISLVDRSANQHADVAIAKRDEGTMTLMDVDGYEVAEDELQPGDVVYDAETGEELVACEEGAEPEDYFTDGDVEKGLKDIKTAYQVARSGLGSMEGGRAARLGDRAGRAMNRAAESDRGMRVKRASSNFNFGRNMNRVEGVRTRDLEEGGSRAIRAGVNAQQYRRRYQGGALVATAGGGYAVHKSLGESVYEELSKSMGTDARDQVISKALADAEEMVFQARQEAAAAQEIAKNLQDQAEFDEYFEIAKSYGLPGDPEEIAFLLKNTADTQGVEAVEKMHALFSAAGEQLFEERGSSLGLQESSVMGQIEAMASQAVAKADVTEAQAIVELFAANDDAYEAYLAETR